MNMKTRSLLILLALLTCSLAFSQKERQLLREGNKAFEAKDFEKAHELYTKSIDETPSFGNARFNLGSSEYMKGDLIAAAKQFEMAAADAIEKDKKAKAFYNEANCYLNAGLYLKHNPQPPAEGEEQPPNPQDFFKKSIFGYKNALRNNPKDEDSRYNLAYAQSLIEEDKGGGEGQDQQENQDQQNQQEQENQDKKDGEDKENKDEQKPEDAGKDKEKEKGEDEQQQPKPGDMTKKEAEQMLKALEQQEKELQGRKGLERIEGEKIKIDKDW